MLHEASSGRTVADWRAQPAGHRFELVAGEFIEKAAPDFVHAHLQGRAATRISSRFDRKPGGKFPGGWWIAPEVDVLLGDDVFRPDLAGWRRARVPVMPRTRPLDVRPDWVCEVVSESNAAHDRVVKLRAHHRAGIPHFWLLDPRDRTLTVLRHADAGYLTVLVATETEVVRPEPFDAVELDLRTLFGDVDDDG